eukprot:gnl/MRDRNA2_/MRDRNA2_37043_c0_seq1.p1 gnl/MRDRNA2_/MRDRNA2_37043_c0~~gnl/MRDRNA2_/MRDRNA2_37043_c0_seq1.p1  ORF type:complete len:533 (+),score=122.82 gnl/MRDRNA2_/MRDRNA2_37043_c0_seq1:172-1770(+)
MLNIFIIVVGLASYAAQGISSKHLQPNTSSDDIIAQGHWRAALRGLSRTIPGHDMTWGQLMTEQEKSKSAKPSVRSHVAEASVRSLTGFRHLRRRKSRHHAQPQQITRNFSKNSSSSLNNTRIGTADLDRVISTILTVNGTLNEQSSNEPIAWCHAKVDHLRVCCWFKDYESSLTEEQLAEFEVQSGSFHGPDSELLAICDKLYQVTCAAPDTRKVCGDEGLCDFMPVCASYQQLPPEAPQGMLLPHCGDAPTEGVEELWESEPEDRSQDILDWIDSRDPVVNASDDIETEEPHADDGLHWKGRLWKPHDEVVEAVKRKEETGTAARNQTDNATEIADVESDSVSLHLHRITDQNHKSGTSASVRVHHMKQHQVDRSTSLKLHRKKMQHHMARGQDQQREGASTTVDLDHTKKQHHVHGTQKKRKKAFFKGSFSKAEQKLRAKEVAEKKYSQALDALFDSSPSLRDWQPMIRDMEKQDEASSSEDDSSPDSNFAKPTEEELEANHDFEEALAAEAQVETGDDFSTEPSGYQL